MLSRDSLVYVNEGVDIAEKCVSIMNHFNMTSFRNISKLKRIGDKRLQVKVFAYGHDTYAIYLELVNRVNGEKIYRFIYTTYGAIVHTYYSATFKLK